MANIYTDGLEHLNLIFAEENALAERNRKAKELRAQGWTVKCGKTDFTDLARDVAYWLEAKRKKG